MRELDIDLDIESTEITDPNPITMVILVHHLHQVLPHYNPNQKNREIMMETCLGASIEREIELKNKSRKKITYRPKFIDTNSVFTFVDKIHQSRDIVISPKSSLKLKIRFKPKFLATEKGTLLISGTNAVGTGKTGATLSFALVGKVIKVKPIFTKTITQSLYTPKSIQLPIENISTKNGMFEVTLGESSS